MRRPCERWHSERPKRGGGDAGFTPAQQKLQAGVYLSYPGFWSGDHVVPRGDSAGVMGRKFDA
jgi:hypothetical protein